MKMVRLVAWRPSGSGRGGRQVHPAGPLRGHGPGLVAILWVSFMVPPAYRQVPCNSRPAERTDRLAGRV